MTLKNTFKLTAGKYRSDLFEINRLWDELVMLYSQKGRYYHTLQHLDDIAADIGVVGNLLADPDAVLFAIYYHDAVYDVVRTDNEEKSADLAAERMAFLQVPDEKILLTRQHIMSTKDHELNNNTDSNYFSGADLAILGKKPEIYRTYCDDIRREYSIYPDNLYTAGRKKVLTHFLHMDSIFKTEHFQKKYAKQARLNVSRKLKIIQYS